MSEYSVFANPDFDPNDYANAILAGEPYPPPTSDSKPGHFQQRVHVPYEALQLLVGRLKKLQEAADVLRRTSRFVILARRLQLQMKEMKERDADGDGISLRSITAVAAFESFVEDSRVQVNAEMEHMVIQWFEKFEPNSPRIFTPNRIITLAFSLNSSGTFCATFRKLWEDRIKSAFDLSKISKEATRRALSSPSPIDLACAQEPTNVTAPQFAAALWGRLEAMFDEMAECCIKVIRTGEGPEDQEKPEFHDAFPRGCRSRSSTTIRVRCSGMSLGTALDKHFRDNCEDFCVSPANFGGWILQALENMVRDRSAVSLLGPIATPQHLLNASLATFLYQSSLRLEQLEKGHTAGVYKLIQPSIQDMYRALVSPVQQAIQREISAILAKLHRINFGQQGAMSNGSSLCLRELAEKLAFIKGEMVGVYDIGEAGRTWIISIVKYTIRNFLLHISIAKPLSEGGKLQMTSDMTELEFALNAFMAENNQAKRGDNLQSLGEEYRALRAMRPLLFLENNQLASSEATTHLPPLIVLHHILVRSPIPLPHKLHGWQEAEYVRWLDEHTDQESWTLIDGGLSHWESISDPEGTDTREAGEANT
ncbi:hypothetical protein FA13DRAFT_1786654 [Coprinellus micaceus]|uniref:Conserved oligomeric Golgi complex subunit 5 helical domain-containing protein n=1 Tax=Coprinellus micaceus TaxID=71717 RepID=A0A4Y7TTP2_COPMI|nr:hypothetical protein FA13DRAFT_1786654 [Coprinellus micaceus]